MEPSGFCGFFLRTELRLPEEIIDRLRELELGSDPADNFCDMGGLLSCSSSSLNLRFDEMRLLNFAKLDNRAGGGGGLPQ